MNIITMAVGAVLLASCSDTIEMRRPPVYELPELPVVEDIHTYKAPLYWSIYEYCYTQEQAGVSNSDMDFTPEQWDEVIDWVARELMATIWSARTVLFPWRQRMPRDT